MIITGRDKDIQAYLASGDPKPQAFDVEFNTYTGRWVPPNGTQVQTVTAARLVIVPDTTRPSGFRIITGHPIPEIDPRN